MNKTWSIDAAPTQNGRIAIVAGANAGLGFETALAGNDTHACLYRLAGINPAADETL
jgi:NAD(P)-dependent dehydrogenase (short-subunit alcohol dehydrogenase family)